MPNNQEPPRIALRGMTKAFPVVLANDYNNLDIFTNEIHAMLGENGVGKSTLMKILLGFCRADSGAIQLKGKPLAIHSPKDARAARIGMVFQDLNLIPAFGVQVDFLNAKAVFPQAHQFMCSSLCAGCDCAIAVDLPHPQDLAQGGNPDHQAG